MRKKLRIGIISCILVGLLYWILIYFLVSAALVPSFMKQLDAFEEITVQSYALQVQTTDIEENHYQSIQETNEWLENTNRKKVTLQSEDGYQLVAGEFLQESQTNKWVLLLHGYTGWKEEMYPIACWYYNQGYHVLVPDLRCQGESEGDFIGMGWTDHKDCLLWLNQILEESPDAQIVVHGQSMGAATALILSGSSSLPKNVVAIISDCAYTDAYSMFEDKCKEWFHLPAFFVVDSACLMLRLRGGYDLKKASAIDAVKKSHTPTLFIHGDKDAMIDVDMAYQLYEAAGCQKELLIVEGAGHAQAQDKSPEQYYGTIKRFLSEL